MADDNRQQDRQAGTVAVEAARRGATAAATAIRAADDATQRGAQAGAEAARRGGRAGAEVVREAGEVARQGTAAAAEGGRQLAAQATEQFEEVGRRLAQSMQAGAEEAWRLMVPPDAASEGLRDLGQALAGLVEGVVRSNLRATQDLLRLADPAAVLELQQRFAREYIGALVEGHATILRATWRTADETLRPIEERLRQRREGGGEVTKRDVRVAGPEDALQRAAREGGRHGRAAAE